jgi:hypothetical protein
MRLPWAARAPARHLLLTLCLGIWFVAPGCMPATLPDGAVPGAAPGPAGPGADSASLIPGGYGSLRQEAITLSVEVDEMQVKVTPLAPEIVRLTAPDTWRRLAGIRDRLAPRLPEAHELVLVSFFTDGAGGAEIDPRDVILVNRSRRFRPVEIAPLTPGWGAGRVQPRRTEQAVYAFSPELDLEMEMGVEVAGRVNRGWATMLPRFEAERSRIRSRAGGTGGGGPHPGAARRPRRQDRPEAASRSARGPTEVSRRTASPAGLRRRSVCHRR